MTFDNATTSSNGVNTSPNSHLEIKPTLNEFKNESQTELPQLTQLMPVTDSYHSQQQIHHQNYSQRDFCPQQQDPQQLMVAVASLHHQQQLAAIAMAAATSANTINNATNEETNEISRGRNSGALIAAQQLSYENCPICGDRVSGNFSRNFFFDLFFDA